MEEVNKRNILALAQSAKDERARLDRLTADVGGLRTTVAGQAAEIAELRQQIGALIARTAGSGPTGAR